MKSKSIRNGFRFKAWKIKDILNNIFLHLYVPGKRYNVADVSAALCMSLGLIWFTLADSKVAPNFNVTGISFEIHLQTQMVFEQRLLYKYRDVGWVH